MLCVDTTSLELALEQLAVIVSISLWQPMATGAKLIQYFE
jgi:hypothetical protein